MKLTEQQLERIVSNYFNIKHGHYRFIQTCNVLQLSEDGWCFEHIGLIVKDHVPLFHIYILIFTKDDIYELHIQPIFDIYLLSLTTNNKHVFDKYMSLVSDDIKIDIRNHVKIKHQKNHNT